MILEVGEDRGSIEMNMELLNLPFFFYLTESLITTPSVPNYKTSQEFWRVKAISSLTKIIKRNIKIYDLKLMYYKNITNKKSNDT